MSLNPKHIQVVSQLASLLYEFLPGTPHPYANQDISFQGCATKAGVGQYWEGGSKRTAISKLLENTLTKSRDRFCPLVLEIVNSAIIYRSSKSNPLKREEVETLNSLIVGVQFKIPELWDKDFLNSLPSIIKDATPEKSNEINTKNLLVEYNNLTKLQPHERGYAFQDFLTKFFNAYGLSPRSPFSIKGEEIDGSFEHEGNIYLLEAKWHKDKTSEKDLLIFRGKIDGKATWSRGLFVSYLGFTDEGLQAFAKGKPANMIGMDGLDIFFILDGKMRLEEAIKRKVRRAAETNEFFVSVQAL